MPGAGASAAGLMRLKTFTATSAPASKPEVWRASGEQPQPRWLGTSAAAGDYYSLECLASTTSANPPEPSLRMTSYQEPGPAQMRGGTVNACGSGWKGGVQVSAHGPQPHLSCWPAGLLTGGVHAAPSLAGCVAGRDSCSWRPTPGGCSVWQARLGQGRPSLPAASCMNTGTA